MLSSFHRVIRRAFGKQQEGEGATLVNMSTENARGLAIAVADGRTVTIAPALVTRPNEPSSITGSSVCKEAHFADPWYGYYCHCLREVPRFHRKQWEFVYICENLARRGLLASGRRGLGFGVGIEPLPAYFASLGCSVIATDMETDAARDAGWASTNQHTNNLSELNRLGICPHEEFEQRVTLAAVDMNDIPRSLGDFDFCWSACALEHLGSIEAGLRFVEESLRPLAPGGVAVHTTEFNLNSNDETLEEGGTVLFRRRDLEQLKRRLEDAGHHVEPFDFDAGDGVLDRYIDVPPYLPAPHLRLLISRYTATSVGLVVTKRP